MKIFKLTQNELFKTWKKTSTKIMLILSVLAIIAAVGFAKLVVSLGGMVSGYETDWKEDTKTQIEDLRASIRNEGNHYDQETLASMEAQLETYELSLKNDIKFLYSYDTYWKRDILSEIQNAKQELILAEKQGRKVDEKLKETTEKKIKLIENDDFSGYIDLKRDEIKSKFDNKQIDEEQYNDEIYLLELEQKYEIFKDTSEDNEVKQSIYRDISTIKTNLRTGLDRTTGKLLTVEEMEELEDKLKINEYRLEKNIPSADGALIGRNIYDVYAPSFSLIMVSILMIMIAGSSISTEISKGTIKFLLFTPNKRWKVLLSKIIAAVIILIAISLILSLLTVLIGNIFFKEDGMIYLYVQNGEVKYLSNLTYIILYYLVSCIDILVYMLFAFMLSTLTHNTALSVRSKYSMLYRFWNCNADCKHASYSRLDKVYTI